MAGLRNMHCLVVVALSGRCRACGFYRCSYCGHCHNPGCADYDRSCAS